MLRQRIVLVSEWSSVCVNFYNRRIIYAQCTSCGERRRKDPRVVEGQYLSSRGYCNELSRLRVEGY
jgi:hypothetical protein